MKHLNIVVIVYTIFLNFMHLTVFEIVYLLKNFILLYHIEIITKSYLISFYIANIK